MSRRPSTRVANAIDVRESEIGRGYPWRLKNSVSCVSQVFKRHRFGTRCSVFSAAHTPQCRQDVGKGGLTFAWIPRRSFRELHPGMPDSVKPGNQNTVEKQRHRARCGQRPKANGWPGLPGPKIVCSFQKCIQWPSDKHRRKEFGGRPRQGWCSRTFGPAGRLGDRARQDDRQQTRAARFAVEGLLRLDGEFGVQAELIEREFGPRFFGIVRPCGHAGQARALFAGRALAALGRRRWRRIQSCLWDGRG